jgi:hypothetical protein
MFYLCFGTLYQELFCGTGGVVQTIDYLLASMNSCVQTPVLPKKKKALFLNLENILRKTSHF